MHASSMRAMARFVADHLSDRRGAPMRVLDVGSMDVNGSYRTLFDDPAWSYTGLDAEEGAGVDVVLPSPYGWQALPTDTYDVVVSGQAFEHIEFPWVSILEVARVLKPGGLFCMLVPSAGYEHRYPVDCWRYYPDGARALARWADLDVVSAETSWEPSEDYPDDSALWKDTVLVARKPDGPVRPQARVKQEALRRLTRLQADRRQSISV